MKKGHECTFIMVDDDIDDIFRTRREIRKQGFVNRFVAEDKPDKLFSTMDRLCELGEAAESFLIFLDLNLGKISGIDFLGTIRSHNYYANTPVIIFSNETTASERDDAKKAGADGFMIKPFSSEDLFNVIDSIPDMKKALIRL